MKTLASLLAAMWLTAPCHAALIHDYELNGSYADSLGGPSLVPDGGTLNATNYSFGPNQGLSLSSALPNPANYSIETVFNFHDLSGFRKILDFKDRGSDAGLYNLNTALNFFPVTTGPSGAFAADQNVRLIVTRDSTNDNFVGYINGVPQISFIDSSLLAVFDQTNNIMRFFEDDFRTGQGEASAGVVDLIRIYNAPLSEAEVRALGGPTAVPEPATLTLLSLGAVGMVLGGWRRRRRAEAVTA